MTSTDRTSPRPAAALTERETHGMHAGHPFVVETTALLDHRTRGAAIPRAGAPAGRYLAVEDGDGAERLLALDRPVTHIGRGLSADVRLEDPHVSRRHAIVATRSEGVRVLDDRSANGTWVNGQLVTVATLADGDVVRVGRAVFRYVEIVAAFRDDRSPHVAPRRRTRPPRRFPIAPARRDGAVLRAEDLRRSAVG